MGCRSSIATSPAPSAFGPLLFAGEWEKALRTAADVGLDGVEISLRSPGEIDGGRLRKLLDEYELRLSAVGTGRTFLEDGLSFSDDDATVREAAVRRMEESIVFAAEFGAAVIVGLIRGDGRSGADPETAHLRIVDGLRRSAEIASRHDVLLVVEAINRYETRFQNTAEQTVGLVREAGAENVGVLLDLFHMNIEEVSLPDAIRNTGELLRYVHVVDSNRWAPGFGHLEYAPVVDALRAIGYQGWLSAEILPVPSDQEAAEQAALFTGGLDCQGPDERDDGTIIGM